MVLFFSLPLSMFLRNHEVLHSTDKALLVRYGSVKSWIPKSSIIKRTEKSLKIEDWLKPKFPPKKKQLNWESFFKQEGLTYAEHCEVW